MEVMLRGTELTLNRSTTTTTTAVSLSTKLITTVSDDALDLPTSIDVLQSYPYKVTITNSYG